MGDDEISSKKAVKNFRKRGKCNCVLKYMQLLVYAEILNVSFRLTFISHF